MDSDEILDDVETTEVMMPGNTSVSSKIWTFLSDWSNLSIALNTGKALLTYIESSVLETFLISLVVGRTLLFKLGLALEINTPDNIWSCLCFSHARGLSAFWSVLIPILLYVNVSKRSEATILLPVLLNWSISSLTNLFSLICTTSPGFSDCAGSTVSTSLLDPLK